jgi:hypothetical protein
LTLQQQLNGFIRKKTGQKPASTSGASASLRVTQDGESDLCSRFFFYLFSKLARVSDSFRSYDYP